MTTAQGLNWEKRRQARKRREIRRKCKNIIWAGALVICVLFGLKTYLDKNNYRNLQSTAYAMDADAQIPDSLKNLAKTNPEAVQFVNDYTKYKDWDKEIDISDEVYRGNIPLFIQWDIRWGYKKYGNDFLAVTGCGPTCLSMVYSGLTGKADIDPYKMGKLAEEEGYYIDGVGTTWSMMTELAEEIGIYGYEISLDKELIIEKLKKGNPIICTMKPGDFTTTGHYIVIKGIDDEGKLIVNDPNSIINSSKKWDIDEVMPQIKNLWCYEK